MHSARDDHRDDLTPEHWSMWDLDIVAEFEVAIKLKSLRHGHIAPCFEQHHRIRAASEGVSDDKLCDDV